MEQVFITGADRGVGFALCEQFVRHGFRVLAGQYMPEWKALETLQEAYPGQVARIPLDVGNTDSVREAVRRTGDICDKVDILVNCAGIIRDDTREGFRATLNTNTVGTLRMTELFLPLMERGKKRLCFFSSEAGSLSMLHRTGDGDSSYCTSKAALNMCVRLLFNELQPKGYTFRLYHPGWVRSYMSGQKAVAGRYEPEESGEAAYRQFTDSRSYEDVLVMTDVKGEVWPF
nr:SDR family NAD(P)-dependent oxidoreductase [uncultured Eisenbergiella sp.]